MKARARTPIDRLAYRVPEEAAEALGMGVTFFKEYVLPDLQTIKRGRLTFVSATELRRWLEAAGTDW